MGKSRANRNRKSDWLESVDPTNVNTVERDIEIIGTGNPMPDGRRTFIGSAVIDPFVWHVFERFE